MGEGKKKRQHINKNKSGQEYTKAGKDVLYIPN